MCSRVTEAGQAAPVASAVAAAVCPPSVMAEMCGGLLLNSMPLPSHTWASRRPLAHTHTNNSMLSITLHYHQRRKKPPLTIWGPEWAMQQSVESALHLTCKIVGRGESVASSECQHFLSFRYQKVCACMRFTMTYCLDSVLFTCLMD